MPVAWLLGAIQRRTHSTVGQKWVLSAGLFIATAGFGEYHVYAYTSLLIKTRLSFLQLSCGSLTNIPV
jgi:hypothetical protein